MKATLIILILSMFVFVQCQKTDSGVSNTQKDKILCWINNGAKNN
ncbi:MAG: hypothetical protein WCO63_04355 [Bacteroidota bacterium]